MGKAPFQTSSPPFSSLQVTLPEVSPKGVMTWKTLGTIGPYDCLSGALLYLQNNRVPFRYSDISWEVFHGKLYVRSNLQRRCPQEASSGSEETMDHFSLFCSSNVCIWHLLASKLRVLLLHSQTYDQLAFGLFQTPEHLP